MKNLLENFKKQNFKFLNLKEDDETSIVYSKNDGISIIPMANSDFFKDPMGKHMMNNAIYMYVEVKGDFVARTHVDHEFLNVWDAACLMIRTDEDNWAKLCFEKTDFGTHTLVSVVTKDGVSDDANGANYYWKGVWLQLIRKDNTFSMFYSPDKSNWHMIRYFSIKANDTISVGLEAQSPIGKGDATMNFYNFELENYTVKDLRTGI